MAKDNCSVAKMVAHIEKYARAVPLGAAIFAVEIYIKDIIMKTRKKEAALIKKNIRRLTHELSKSPKNSSSKLEELRKLNQSYDKLKTTPTIHVAYSKDLTVKDGALAVKYVDKWDIALSEEVFMHFLSFKKSVCPKPCESAKESNPNCGKRYCMLKQASRKFLGHELSHIIANFVLEYDEYLRENYEISEETGEPETGHDKFSYLLDIARDEYLKGN